MGRDEILGSGWRLRTRVERMVEGERLRRIGKVVEGLEKAEEESGKDCVR